MTTETNIFKENKTVNHFQKMNHSKAQLNSAADQYPAIMDMAHDFVAPKRMKIEMNFAGGYKRFFTCNAKREKEAMREALHVVDCIQRETGKDVLWRFTHEDNYRIGVKFNVSPSSGLINNVKKGTKKFLDYFFDLD